MSKDASQKRFGGRAVGGVDLPLILDVGILQVDVAAREDPLWWLERVGGDGGVVVVEVVVVGVGGRQQPKKKQTPC